MENSMKKALLTSTAVLAIGMFGFGINAASAATPLLGVNNTPVAVSTGTNSTATSINKSAIDNTSVSHSLNGSGDNNGSNNNVPIAATDRGAAASQNSTAGYATTSRAHDTATSGTGDAINNSTVGSYNGAGATTGSGGGVAASSNGFALQLNGSGNDLAPGAVLSNGSLSATSSFNHVDADLTLATAKAGGSMGGRVTNNNQDPKGAVLDPSYSEAGFYNDNGSRVSNTIAGSTGVITANANGNGIAQFNTSVAAVGVDNSSGLMHR